MWQREQRLVAFKEMRDDDELLLSFDAMESGELDIDERSALISELLRLLEELMTKVSRVDGGYSNWEFGRGVRYVVQYLFSRASGIIW